MGLIQKKEQSVIDGIEVVGRGEGPDGLESNPIDLVAGESAEDIAAGTTAAEAAAAAQAKMVADAKDDALMEGIEDASDAESDAADDSADAASPIEDHHAKTEKKREAVSKKPAESEKKPAAVATASEPAKPKAGRKGGAKHGIVFCVLALALIVIAGIGGYFLGNGGFGAKGTGTATLTEDQLGSTVATWSYNGKKHDVTAKDAIEAQYSLDSAKNSEGKYAAPTSETIVSYIRNQILLAEADSRNITVTDDEMKEYAESTIGTSSYSDMATQYGVSEDQAKQIVKENTTINKLYKQIVPDGSGATQPTPPTEPSDGNTATASKEYADYIIKLAGDEWDSSKGAWASEDGPYYAALKDEKFTADSATYAQAQTAYYVAYQQYAQSSQETQSKWSEFANGLYAKANVDIYGLYV